MHVLPFGRWVSKYVNKKIFLAHTSLRSRRLVRVGEERERLQNTRPLFKLRLSNIKDTIDINTSIFIFNKLIINRLID